ncbi:hypothetical protein SY88_04530 [Clostridiales bacterium PH28_bin88]|nr:hypothetical protein SY88_04530 [Clostridiales bacterium PH28_bin88]
MATRSVIIIGAGLAGLAAGCYCQMNGYPTRIFEHHHKPGGVATTWKRKGYTIDGGIHFLMGHKPGQSIHELYRELGIHEAIRVLDMTVYGRYLDEASGRSVEITKDLDRLAAELKAFSPSDARAINDLMAGARAMQGSDMGKMGLAKPPELLGRLDGLKQMWAMRRVFKYFTGKYAEPVAEYTRGLQHPFLRQVIENLFLPEVPVWFILMLLGMLAEGQIGLLADGALNFARTIENRYKQLGGQVTYKATVEEILVEDDRAVGVRLADGSEYRGDIVVSAADGYSTIFKMLGGRYADEKIKSRYANWKLFCPLMIVSYGVARKFPGEPPLTTIMLKHPFNVNNRPVNGILVRIFNYTPEFSPPGKTVVQVEFEVEWDYWNNLQKEDRARYDADKERIATEILERLEAHYPGISSQVEVTDVATPYTTWRYTRNYRGAWEGWLPTPEAITTMIERALPGIQNFYMAGQWVMPGGGVVPCLYSGRHVAEILCSRDKKRFATVLP